MIEDTEKCAELAETQDLAEYSRRDIRAVQSIPLIGRGGRRLGTLSTHWRKPHRVSRRDFEFFDVLARQAADLIERTLAQAALRESEAKYRTLFGTIDAGYSLVEVLRDENGQAIDLLGSRSIVPTRRKREFPSLLDGEPAK